MCRISVWLTLQLDLGGDRVMPLIKFRGSVRPVILAGTKAFVDKAMRDAEPYQIELRKRGVSRKFASS